MLSVERTAAAARPPVHRILPCNISVRSPWRPIALAAAPTEVYIDSAARALWLL